MFIPKQIALRFFLYRTRLSSVRLFGISKKPSFTIAHGSDWYSYPLLGKENNLLAFVDELLQNIALDQNIKLELITVSTDSLLRGLNNETYQGAIALFNPSTLTQDIYTVSEPFFLLGPVLVVQTPSSIRSIKDLEGKTVGILRGSSTAYEFAKYPSIIIIPYENILFALEKLSRGEIDGVILPLIPAYVYTESLYPQKLKVITSPLTNEGFRLIAKHTSQGHELIDYFDRGLKNLQESGQYNNLIKKWDLFVPIKK